MSNLVIAIDLSEDEPRVIALVGAREHVLKTRVVGNLCSGLEHYRKVPSWRKPRYLKFFEKRYVRLKPFLDIARIVFSPSEAERLLLSIRPSLVVVDNKLLKSIDYEPKIAEDAPKPRYLDKLITIADNLANYFRLILKNDPKQFREELKKFEK